MATRKRKSTPSMGTLLLVTATEAEAIFFSQMRKDCRYANLTVMHSGAKTLAEHISFTSKAKFKNRFDAAFALFGFDDVNTKITEVKTDETKHYQELLEKDSQQDIELKKHKDKIHDLDARTKGIGGYLNAYNFQKAKLDPWCHGFLNIV